ncbi:MAG: hypothetical protein ACYDCQ_05750 [Dehalococcoidia bacterium]
MSPKQLAGAIADTIAKSQAREDKEAEVIRRLQAGASTMEIYGFDT